MVWIIIEMLMNNMKPIISPLGFPQLLRTELLLLYLRGAHRRLLAQLDAATEPVPVQGDPWHGRAAWNFQGSTWNFQGSTWFFCLEFLMRKKQVVFRINSE